MLIFNIFIRLFVSLLRLRSLQEVTWFLPSFYDALIHFLPMFIWILMWLIIIYSEVMWELNCMFEAILQFHFSKLVMFGQVFNPMNWGIASYFQFILKDPKKWVEIFIQKFKVFYLKLPSWFFSPCWSIK